jgi:hypothetical protein
MIGLLLLVILGMWLLACLWIASKLGNIIPRRRWRAATKSISFLVLLALPFVDEVIGKRQFEALCRANGIESADVSNAHSKKVKVEYGERKSLHGTAIPIQESNVIFRDADTSEILIRHKNYYAQGGWVMRYTWLSLGSNQAMLFGGSTCDIRKEQEIFKANSITFLYK